MLAPSVAVSVAKPAPVLRPDCGGSRRRNASSPVEPSRWRRCGFGRDPLPKRCLASARGSGSIVSAIDRLASARRRRTSDFGPLSWRETMFSSEERDVLRRRSQAGFLRGVGVAGGGERTGSEDDVRLARVVGREGIAGGSDWRLRSYSAVAPKDTEGRPGCGSSHTGQLIDRETSRLNP